MATVVDSFDGANGTPLGVIPGTSLQWTPVSGTGWVYQNSKAVCNNPIDSNSLVVVDLSTQNYEVSCDIGSGGGALYFRVQGSGNWLRLRQRYYVTSSTYTYYVTQYQWAGYYTHAAIAGAVNPSAYYYYSGYIDDGSQPAGYPPSSVTVSHQHDSENNGSYELSHSHSFFAQVSGGFPQWIKQTTNYSYPPQQVQRSGTTYNYYYNVYLEKCVNYGISTVHNYSGYWLSNLRVLCQGQDISVYFNDSFVNQVTVPEFANATKAGVGFGYSENGTPSLDNFTATYTKPQGWGVPI